MNIDLKHLVYLLLANKIRLCITKMEIIIFRRPRQKLKINSCIKLNGHKLTLSPPIKYLGILLDETLSGKAQCKVLIDKLIRANAMLSKIRHYLPEEQIISVYHAIFPVIYPMVVKFGAKTKKVHSLKKFQIFKNVP